MAAALCLTPLAAVRAQGLPSPKGPAATRVAQAPGPLSPNYDPIDDWSVGDMRPFVAGLFDTGYLYIRPRFSFGYGRPHHTWIGIDANPLASGEGVGGYLGLRGALPMVNLRIGGRGFYTFERSFLCPTDDFAQPEACQEQEPLGFYNREDIESRIGPTSAYISFEAELTLNLRIGPGNIIGELAGTLVTGVDQGFFVYEETVRVVLAPPWVWRVRGGYRFPLDAARSIRVGVVAELVGVPGRDMFVLRGGFVGNVRLYHNLEARGIFVPALVARDTLGAAAGDAFLLGVRYRWATE